ncbi:hypothetical protein AB0I58_40630 [Spirillospora sp. NPDC050365]
MLEPVTATKVLLPPKAPSETLPLMVPELTKTLPPAPGLENATRPVMVPVLVKLTLPPP